MAGISFASDLDFLREDTETVELACESVNHLHRTCHFEGPFDALNDLGSPALGVDLTKLI